MEYSIWLILTPILVTGLTQLVKVLVGLIQTGRAKGQDYFKWGGFPSSHSALVGSLVTLVGLMEGVYSVSFMITIAFGILVVRDAMGLREFVENHAKAINVLRELLSKEGKKKVPKQVDSVGHTIPEVIGGLVFGILVSVLVYLFIVGP